MTMKLQPQAMLRFAITAVVVIVALILCHILWRHYMYSPWTRDGRVRAEVVRIAPDVSGLVTRVPVIDNQEVKKGDVLFEIDPQRFQIALEQA
jgi:multidrug resistance efflux pump